MMRDSNLNCARRLFSPRRAFGRGAVFVESIIVLTFLSIFLAGSLFFHRLYVTKLKTIETVRAETWKKALGGCDDGMSGLSDLWGELAHDPGESGVSSSKSVSFLGAPENTTGSQSAQVTADALLGGKSYALAAKINVACNEKKQSGTIFDLGAKVIDMIPPIW